MVQLGALFSNDLLTISRGMQGQDDALHDMS